MVIWTQIPGSYLFVTRAFGIPMCIVAMISSVYWQWLFSLSVNWSVPKVHFKENWSNVKLLFINKLGFLCMKNSLAKGNLYTRLTYLILTCWGAVRSIGVWVVNSGINIMWWNVQLFERKQLNYFNTKCNAEM